MAFTGLRAIGISLAFAITFAGFVPLHAQVSGATILGTVSDQSGAVVPNATVSVKGVATGAIRTGISNSAGFYAIPNLLPGDYLVSGSARGFATAVTTGIKLTVGAQRTVDMVLTIGALNESVKVEERPTTVDLTRSGISAVVDGSEVRELPLNGRDWSQLATLQPGVESVRTQSPVGGFSGDVSRVARGLGNQLTISGMRPSQNNYRLDGISFNDYTNDAPGGVLGNISGVDAIQEFSVLTTNYSAEYGMTSGGVINAVTRSGTDQFHGNVYEFLRNSALDAKNFFDTAIPPFKRNQFGASVGGPIHKDDTFAFFNYEGLRQSLSTTVIDTVPSLNARSGILASGPIPGGVDSAVVPYLPLWPLPNGPVLGTGDTAEFSYINKQSATENFYTARVDHRFSVADNFSGTFAYDNNQITNPNLINSVLLLENNSRPFVSLEETHIFSPQLANSIRFGFSRFTAKVDTSETIDQLAADPSLGAVPGRPAPALVVPGVTNFFGPDGTSLFTVAFNTFQAYDDAFLTHGKHSLKFGFAFERFQSNNFFQDPLNGEFDFGSLEGFLTNQPDVFFSVFKTPTPRGLRSSLFGGYIQDDWRLRPNLTLNLGLRYEMSTVPTEVQNRLATLLNLTDAQPRLGSPYFANPTLRNFEPRVGFAWDPFRQGKTVIHAGFGMFDVLPLPYEFFLMAATSFPYDLELGTGNLPPGAFPTGAYDFLASQIGTLIKSARVGAVQQNPARNYVMQWNLNVQQQLGPRSTLLVAYVGSRGEHMPIKQDDVNMVIPTKTPEGYLFPSPAGSGKILNPNFGELDLLSWQADSYYNGLQVGVNSQFHNLQLRGSYTWSKSIDTGSSTLAGDQFSNGLNSLPYWFDPALRRGLSDFNIGQAVTISGMWDIGNRSLAGPVGWVLNGWKLGEIFQASGGVPFTPIIGGDPLGTNDTVPVDYPNRLTGPGCQSPVNPGNPFNYIKTQCFTFPTPSTLLGNAGRNSIIGPGYVDLDFSIFKDNHIKRISESFDIQFRAELFNVLNHPNFAPPIDNSTLFNGDGSAVGGAGLVDKTQSTSRQIQFGLKVIW